MIFDVTEVLAQALQHVVVLPVGDFAFNFGEGKVHDVMMVNFGARKLFAELQPHTMQQLDFVGREPRGVRP